MCISLHFDIGFWFIWMLPTMDLNLRWLVLCLCDKMWSCLVNTFDWVSKWSVYQAVNWTLLEYIILLYRQNISSLEALKCHQNGFYLVSALMTVMYLKNGGHQSSRYVIFSSILSYVKSIGLVTDGSCMLLPNWVPALYFVLFVYWLWNTCWSLYQNCHSPVREEERQESEFRYV